jgi:MarR family transcriptional regulator for hemolysin
MLDALRFSVSSKLVLSAKQWRRASHTVLAPWSVSEACATPLLVAGRLGEAVRQVTLADKCGIEASSMVRLLDRLCATGLATRHDDPLDRRAKTISLTDEGREITKNIEAELVGLHAQVLSFASRDDLLVTLRVLEAFLSAPSLITSGSADRSASDVRLPSDGML